MLTHQNPANHPSPAIKTLWSGPVRSAPEPGHGATEVLNTAACLHVGEKLVELEDTIFGTDFTWRSESLGTWLRSNCMFYAAVVENSRGGQKAKICAVISLFLAERESCHALVKGEILEPEIRPWSGPACGSPVLYFASIASKRPDYVPRMYGCLLADVETYIRARPIQCDLGLSIASSPAGLNHLTKNGFYAWGTAKYLRKYPILRVDAISARTLFWRRLLQPRARG